MSKVKTVRIVVRHTAPQGQEIQLHEFFVPADQEHLYLNKDDGDVILNLPKLPEEDIGVRFRVALVRELPGRDEVQKGFAIIGGEKLQRFFHRYVEFDGKKDKSLFKRSDGEGAKRLCLELTATSS